MSLDFALGNYQMQIDAKERFAAGSGTYNLYVRQQADWAPPTESGRSRALMGSADRGDLK
jgi:hypothetical protein